MASSPTSTASSSNLCFNSESRDLDAQHHNNHNAFGIQGQSQPSAGERGLDAKLYPPFRSEESRLTQAPVTSEHVGIHAFSDSTPGELRAKNAPSGDHKRKREDDAEISQSLQSRSPAAKPMDNLPYPIRTIGFDLAETNSSDGKGHDYMDVRPSSKRTKSTSLLPGYLPISRSSAPSTLLPAEVWQQIFCFVPPVSLGRLLRVNRAFHACLVSETATQQDAKQRFQGVTRPLKPEAIWAASRACFCPGLPRPIYGFQELRMWRLLRGCDCQICGETKLSSPLFDPENPWECGPGEAGVRVIWPLGVRCCGRCVQKCTEKEVNLLFSDAADLLPALPFVFLSATNHYIASCTLRKTTPPSDLQLTKYYYKPHIEEIKRRFNEAKELGNAAADEWKKGLASEGHEKLDEITRWEELEFKGGLRKVNFRPQKLMGTQGTAKFALDRSVPTVQNVSKTTADTRSSTPLISNLTSFIPKDVMASSSSSRTPFPLTENLSSQQSTLAHNSRPERSMRDVKEAKAMRKAEIERRCAALDPPLPPNILNHMESFQAAILISQPLTDHAWDLLKPRLLAQRLYAERREKEGADQNELPQATSKHRRQQEVQPRDVKDNLDREWESLQAPVRNEISAFADERIASRWSDGRSVTKETSPTFAVDILLHVRERFYNEAILAEAAVGTPSEFIASNSPRRPYRILSLENMKWLFDTKVKPITEYFQKEIFLCNFLCNGGDGNLKFYSFESVIQHYAAKHTTILSHGNQVVHWRAEWPEHPPFHPEPNVAKTANYKIPPPAMLMGAGPASRGVETSSHFEGSNSLIHSASKVAPAQYGLPHFRPGPYNDVYNSQQHNYLPYSPSMPPNQYQPVQDDSWQRQAFHHNPNNSFDFAAPEDSSAYGTNYSNAYTSIIPDTTSQTFLPQTSNQGPPDPMYPQDRRNLHRQDPQPFISNSRALFGESYQHQLSTEPVRHDPQNRIFHREAGNSTTSLYQYQQAELAKQARDLWSATSGIEDIPQSVRIFVIIQHMVARFKDVFSNEPSLGMFLDGLDNNPLMWPIRSLNSLACKVCVNKGNSSRDQYTYSQPPTGDICLHTLPQLLGHFRTVHLGTMPSQHDSSSTVERPRPDWKLDMIELPEAHLIADSLQSSDLDDQKVALFAKVFPAIFHSLPPGIRVSGPIAPYTEDSYFRTRSTQDNLPVSYRNSPVRLEARSENQSVSRPFSAFRELSQPAGTSEPPGEDEYDPHRPAYLDKLAHRGRQIAHSHGQRDLPPRVRLSPTVESHKFYTPIKSPETIHRTGSTASSSSNRKLAADERSNQNYGHLKHEWHPRSGRTTAESSSDDNIHETYRLSHQKPDGNGVSRQHNAPNSHMSENDEPNKHLSSSRIRRRSSPPQEETSAVDAFLDNLASGTELDLKQRLTPLDQEGNRVVDQTRNNSPAGSHLEDTSTGNESQGWKIRGMSTQGQDSNPRPISIHQELREERHQLEVADRSNARSERGENHPLTSRFRRAPSVFGDERSPGGYPRYEAPARSFIPERYRVGQNVPEADTFKREPFHVTGAAQYRSRSRSPPAMPVSATYYRARSPANGSRKQSYYRVHSPPFRRDIRPQRIISYDYPPQDNYDYIENRRTPDLKPRHRVEYVPLEPARYLIAQSPEIKARPDYIRVDRDYGGGPVYEHHGQLYQAEPRPYHGQPSHRSPTYIQGYRY